MKRLTTFIVLILVVLPSHALSITCLKAESEKQRVQWLDESFNKSQVVVQLGNPMPTGSATTKHQVLRVWKGVVGEYVYVTEGAKSGLLFTSRVNNNGPLKSQQTYCQSLSDNLVSVSTLALLKQNYGNGYEPDTELLEPQFAKTYLHWFFMFGFVLLVLVSMITYSFVRYRSEKQMQNT